MVNAGIYKNTVNLPDTTFSMRANAKSREPEIQDLWQQNAVYESLLQNNTQQSFTLHDGYGASLVPDGMICLHLKLMKVAEA